jgi:hypothetical protein
MRIAIFLFLILILSNQTSGQDSPLFVIVSCSEGALLDGKLVSPGEMVSANSVQLTIPGNGYAGVITREGYALELNRSIQVKRVVDQARGKNQLKMEKKHRTPGAEFETVGIPPHKYAEMDGDSILIAIKDKNKIGPPYIIEWIKINGLIVETETIYRNWEVKSIKNLMKLDTILFRVKGSDRFSIELGLLKPPNDNGSEKLKFDLSQIRRGLPDEIVLRLAIYQLNQFYYDHLFCLYQLERSNYQPQNKIFSNYISQQKKKYQFELFDFHK